MGSSRVAESQKNVGWSPGPLHISREITDYHVSELQVRGQSTWGLLLWGFQSHLAYLCPMNHDLPRSLLLPTMDPATQTLPLSCPGTCLIGAVSPRRTVLPSCKGDWVTAACSRSLWAPPPSACLY